MKTQPHEALEAAHASYKTRQYQRMIYVAFRSPTRQLINMHTRAAVQDSSLEIYGGQTLNNVNHN
jgi:hypothetical protein